MSKRCIQCQTQIERPTTFSDLVFWKALHTDLVCENCRQQFDSIKLQEACPCCSKPNTDGNKCSECNQWQALYPDLTGIHRSLYHYNQFAKDWMIQFKLKGDIRFGLVFAQMLKDTIELEFPDHLIVPIPSSAKNFSERGFNQIDVILSSLAMEFSRVLINTAEGVNQSKKSRQERMRTPQPFTAVEGIELSGVDVLLMDDVYTTGRTLYHAKKVVHDLGANRVDSLSLFR